MLKEKSDFDKHKCRIILGCFGSRTGAGSNNLTKNFKNLKFLQIYKYKYNFHHINLNQATWRKATGITGVPFFADEKGEFVENFRFPNVIFHRQKMLYGRIVTAVDLKERPRGVNFFKFYSIKKIQNFLKKIRDDTKWMEIQYQESYSQGSFYWQQIGGLAIRKCGVIRSNFNFF